MGEIKPDEWRKAIINWLAMLVLGTVVTAAVVSLAVGAAQARQRRAR